jgi:hypothetical protein
MIYTILSSRKSSQKKNQLLGFEVFQVRLQKNNRFYRDTQMRNFRPLEDKSIHNNQKNIVLT